MFGSPAVSMNVHVESGVPIRLTRGFEDGSRPDSGIREEQIDPGDEKLASGLHERTISFLGGNVARNCPSRSRAPTVELCGDGRQAVSRKV
jgi:hypothetical protein